MSWLRWVVGCTLLVLGCQGEYPIAPTACDEWCDATHGLVCLLYDPAACVSDCEEQKLSRNEACRPLFDATLACFRSTPGAVSQQCSFGSIGRDAPCQVELQALYQCTSDPAQS